MRRKPVLEPVPDPEPVEADDDEDLDERERWDASAGRAARREARRVAT